MVSLQLSAAKLQFFYDICKYYCIFLHFLGAKCSNVEQYLLWLFILHDTAIPKSHTIMTKQQIIKIIISVLIAALTALGAAFGLSSCNVVRTVTNRSEFYQRGDTSVMIQTKTTESYDAKKNLMY